MVTRAKLNAVDASAWLAYFAETANAGTFAVMQRGRVIDLDSTLALRAASIGLEHKLPLTDSIMYATARELGATVWTQDADVEGLPDVEYAPALR